MNYRSAYFELAGEDFSDQLTEEVRVREGEPTAIFIAPRANSTLSEQLNDLQQGKKGGAVRFALRRDGTVVRGTGLQRRRQGEYVTAYPPSED
jgi:hypothetical protein